MLRVRTALSGVLIALAASLSTGACTRSPSETRLETGKPVFQFDYEAVRSVFLSRNEPGAESWTAEYVVDGWLGPQQVTPRWMIRQAPAGLTSSSANSEMDRLADGSFLRHLLDSVRTLRKTGETADGEDAGFGLAPAWTQLRWKTRDTTFELLLGSPCPTGGRYARIGSQRLVVDGAALDMLGMASDFERTRHRRLLTWQLDDADRVRLRWPSSIASAPEKEWSVERHSGDWIRLESTSLSQTTKKTLPRSPESELEALAHLQIAQFDLKLDEFGKPILELEWKDRKEHELVIQIDQQLRAKVSDRPATLFRLHPEARKILSPSYWPH